MLESSVTLDSVSPPSEQVQRKLRLYNIGLAVLHGVTAVALGILAGVSVNDATVPWYSSLPGARPDGSPKNWTPILKKHTDVVVGWFAFIFLILASLNHLYVSTIGWESYIRNLTIGRNPVRWFEYSFSASFMHVHVAMLAGMMDEHMCFLVFGLTQTTMIFGYFAEPDAKGRKSSTVAFWLGFLPYAYQWLVILCYFFSAVSRGSPPGFVWAIIFIIGILDVGFAVNLYLNLIGFGKWSSFIHTEIVFCLLSLTSKQLLAWINYGGTRALNA